MAALCDECKNMQWSKSEHDLVCIELDTPCDNVTGDCTLHVQRVNKIDDCRDCPECERVYEGEWTYYCHMDYDGEWVTDNNEEKVRLCTPCPKAGTKRVIEWV